MELTESTLEVVEPYLKKPHFNGDYLEKKTNNPAVGSLLLWVRGVVRYILTAVTALPINCSRDNRLLFRLEYILDNSLFLCCQKGC